MSASEAAIKAVDAGVLRARLRRIRLENPAPVAADAVPPPPPASIERIAATAAARAARRAAALSATAEAVRVQGVSLSELPELLPERALIAVIEAPGDRLGVAALCPAFLSSLIEMQAIGRVTSRAVDSRRPTRADASLAAEFVNHLLEELAQSLAGLADQDALAGYRYASHLDDPRPLLLMLDDAGFRSLRIELRLGAGGERRGVLLVAVPAALTDAARDGHGSAPEPSKADAPARLAPPLARPSLASAMQHAPVMLAGVLCRRHISLRELRALRPGATIALPRAALDAASLETQHGQKLARAKLGEANGFHALRLRHPDAAAEAVAAHAPVPASAVHEGNGAGRNAPQPLFGHGIAGEPPIADLSGPDEFRPPSAGSPRRCCP